MEQLLAHLIGDYVLQNHYIATRKTQQWEVAAIHVALYGLPFVFLVGNLWQLVVIIGTHYLIDHYRLAAYWVDFWGTGKEGALLNFLMRKRGFAKVDIGQRSEGGLALGTEHFVWEKVTTSGLLTTRTQAPILSDAPPWLGVWLLIIVDNTLHLSINFATLRWLVWA